MYPQLAGFVLHVNLQEYLYNLFPQTNNERVSTVNGEESENLTHNHYIHKKYNFWYVKL